MIFPTRFKWYCGDFKENRPMLEFLWSTGRDLVIRTDYEIEAEASTKEGLFRAFYLLCELFERGIVERNSTLHAEVFGPAYSKATKRASHQGDWLFARHWHSTLIEILTAKDEEGHYYLSQHKGEMDLKLSPFKTLRLNYRNPY
jgi:hypothetical protein